MKTKENSFKNFNEVKVIVKLKNLQVIYVRNLRASLLACKYYKIYTKTLKILLDFLILFFSVRFRRLGLCTLCSHTTKISC